MPGPRVTTIPNLGQRIRDRRTEMGLTIAEAATKAGVTSTSWVRYENGAPIRNDLVPKLCKALRWRQLPGTDDDPVERTVLSDEDFQDQWSMYLERGWGRHCARAFALGIQGLLDGQDEALTFLAGMPPGTHMGQDPVTGDLDPLELPAEFLTRYDYDFIWTMRAVTRELVLRYKLGPDQFSNGVDTPLELIIFCSALRSGGALLGDLEDRRSDYPVDVWLDDMFGEDDLGEDLDGLYSTASTEPGSAWHFDNWLIPHGHVGYGERTTLEVRNPYAPVQVPAAPGSDSLTP